MGEAPVHLHCKCSLWTKSLQWPQNWGKNSKKSPCALEPPSRIDTRVLLGCVSRKCLELQSQGPSLCVSTCDRPLSSSFREMSCPKIAVVCVTKGRVTLRQSKLTSWRTLPATLGARHLFPDCRSLESFPLQPAWQPPSLKKAAVTEVGKVMDTLLIQKDSETSQLGPSTIIA